MVDTEPLMTLGQMRERRGLTRTDMARKLGVSRQTYYRWEDDPKMIRLRDVESICEALRCSPEDIIGFRLA